MVSPLLAKIAGKKSGNFVVAAKMNGERAEHVQFTDGGNGEHNTRLVIRTLSQEYPDYARLFPSDQPSAVITYERLPLIAAIKAAAKTDDNQRAIFEGPNVRNVTQTFSAELVTTTGRSTADLR